MDAGERLIESFNYTVRDTGGLTDTAVLTITITGANDAPVASDDNGSATALVVPTPPAMFWTTTPMSIVPIHRRSTARSPRSAWVAWRAQETPARWAQPCRGSMAHLRSRAMAVTAM